MAARTAVTPREAAAALFEEPHRVIQPAHAATQKRSGRLATACAHAESAGQCWASQYPQVATHTKEASRAASASLEAQNNGPRPGAAFKCLVAACKGRVEGCKA